MIEEKLEIKNKYQSNPNKGYQSPGPRGWHFLFFNFQC